MKILVLNGSPKKKSDTMHLTNSFFEGMNLVTSNDIEIIDVIEKEIAPCRGCFGCWAAGNAKCVIDDYQNTILEKYLSADLCIWSFPLYCFGLPSHLKAVLDRFIPLVKMDMVQVGDEVRHVCNADLSQKKNIIICGAGFPYSEGNFEGVKITGKKCFHDPTMIFVPETPLLNVEEAKSVADIKKAQFIEAGKEFAQNGKLTEETITTLESLMISNEDYLRKINGE